MYYLTLLYLRLFFFINALFILIKLLSIKKCNGPFILTYKKNKNGIKYKLNWNHFKELSDSKINYIFRIASDKIKGCVLTFPKWPEVGIKLPKTKDTYSSIGENCCIKTMEWLFPNFKFKKIRPIWLKNPKTNRNLELDGYCEELKIAIEYNGIQHYNWPNFCSQTLDEFNKQRARDLLKYKLCVLNNVYLIHVPYTVVYSKIPYYIYLKLINSVPEKYKEDLYSFNFQM